MPCSICGESGHNKKSCVVYKTILADAVAAETVAEIVTEITELEDMVLVEPMTSEPKEAEPSEPAELIDVNAILFLYYSQTRHFHVLHPILSCLLNPTLSQLLKDRTGDLSGSYNKISRNRFFVREPVAEPDPNHHTLM